MSYSQLSLPLEIDEREDKEMATVPDPLLRAPPRLVVGDAAAPAADVARSDDATTSDGATSVTGPSLSSGARETPAIGTACNDGRNRDRSQQDPLDESTASPRSHEMKPSYARAAATDGSDDELDPSSSGTECSFASAEGEVDQDGGEHWDRMFEAYRAYVNKHKKWTVPGKCVIIEGRDLGYWVNNLRCHWKKLLKGGSSWTGLQNRRFERLKEIGFHKSLGVELSKRDLRNLGSEDLTAPDGLDDELDLSTAGTARSFASDAGGTGQDGDERWDRQFEAYRSYVTMHNKLMIPTKSVMVEGRDLGHWAKNLRGEWKNVFAGKIPLTDRREKRFDRLKAIGFFDALGFHGSLEDLRCNLQHIGQHESFDDSQGLSCREEEQDDEDENGDTLIQCSNQRTRDAAWEEMFQGLLNFHSVHKKWSVPVRYQHAGKDLQIWANYQRTIWRRAQSASATMKPWQLERLNRLEAVGFFDSVATAQSQEKSRASASDENDDDLDVSVAGTASSYASDAGTAEQDERWDQMFDAYRSYVSKHNKWWVRPKVVMVEGRDLGQWVSNLRAHWRKVLKGNNAFTALQKMRYERLTEIGFFKTLGENVSLGNPNRDLIGMGQDSFDDSQDVACHGAEHDGSLVPSSHPRFGAGPRHDSAWEEMFQGLLDYHSAHKKWRLPLKYQHAGKDLHSWANHQRKLWRTAQSGTASLPQWQLERLDRLEAVGYFESSRGSPKGQSLTASAPLVRETVETLQDPQWEECYEGLLEYYQKYKSFRVPSGFLYKNRQLDRWVSEQEELLRRSICNGDNDLTPQELSHCRRLRDLGFSLPEDDVVDEQAPNAMELKPAVISEGCSVSTADTSRTTLPDPRATSVDVGVSHATELDPMVLALKSFHDLHGTWSVGPECIHEGSRLDVWLTLRQQEYKKLSGGGRLSEPKTQRLKQLAQIGYDFGIDGGPSLLQLTSPLVSRSKSAEAVSASTMSESEKGSTQIAPACSAREENADDLARLGDSLMAPQRMPFASTNEFLLARDKILDDLDRAILKAEWNASLAELDRAITYAELCRSQGMERAEKWGVCIKRDRRALQDSLDRPLAYDSIDDSGYNNQHLLGSFCEGIVDGSIEGSLVVKAVVCIPKQFMRGDEEVLVSLADLKDFIASFFSESGASNNRRGVKVHVSDSFANDESYLLSVVGEESVVVALKAQTIAWIIGNVVARKQTRSSVESLQEDSSSSNSSAKRQQYLNFCKVFGDSVSYEFRRSDVHKNAVLGYMWNKHKSLVGENCTDSCVCFTRMPDLLEGFNEAFKDASLEPLGFMTTFASENLQAVMDEHPSESPKMILDRLKRLYIQEPTLRRKKGDRDDTHIHDESQVSQRIPRKLVRSEEAPADASLLSHIIPRKRVNEDVDESGINDVSLPAFHKRLKRNDSIGEHDPSSHGKLKGLTKRNASTLNLGLPPKKVPRENAEGCLTHNSVIPQRIPRKRNSGIIVNVEPSVTLPDPGLHPTTRIAHHQRVDDSSNVRLAVNAADRAGLDTGVAGPISYVHDPDRPYIHDGEYSNEDWNKLTDEERKEVKQLHKKRKAKANYAKAGDDDEKATPPAEMKLPNIDEFAISSKDVKNSATNNALIRSRQPLRSIMRRESASPKPQRRLRYAETSTGDLLVETIVFDPLNPVNSSMSSLPNGQSRDDSGAATSTDRDSSAGELDDSSDSIALSITDLSLFVRGGSFAEVLNTFESGRATKLSVKELVLMRDQLVPGEHDLDAKLKVWLLDLYIMTAELIGWHQSERNFFSLVTRVVDVDGLQGPEVQSTPDGPPKALKVTVVLYQNQNHESQGALKWLELTNPLLSRVIFESDEVEGRLSKRFDAQNFEFRLKTVTNVPGDKGVFIGAGTLLLHNVYVTCRDSPGLWHEFTVDIKPYKYALGACIDEGARVRLQAKLADGVQGAHQRISALVEYISSFQQDIVRNGYGAKITGNVWVAKSSLLHVAVAVGHAEGVKELLQLGANPLAQFSGIRPAYSYAMLALERHEGRARGSPTATDNTGNINCTRFRRLEEVVKTLRGAVQAEGMLTNEYAAPENLDAADATTTTSLRDDPGETAEGTTGEDGVEESVEGGRGLTNDASDVLGSSELTVVANTNEHCTTSEHNGSSAGRTGTAAQSRPRDEGSTGEALTIEPLSHSTDLPGASSTQLDVDATVTGCGDGNPLLTDGKVAHAKSAEMDEHIVCANAETSLAPDWLHSDIDPAERCLSFNGVTQCNDGVACRKWHVYVPLKDTLDAKVRLKSPLYAKGKIFRTSIRHKESTTDGRRWFTAGYKNDDLRKIFYAEGKGRNKKGFQDASGVWWYPSLDDAELALVTVIASAHNATASNDNANQQDAVLESEAGSVSARNTEPAPPNQPNTSECDIDPSASLANRRSLEVDQFPGLEKNSVTGFEIRPTEQLKETNASTQECRVSSEMVHDSAPPSGAPPSGLCLSSKDDRGADTGAGAPVSRLSPSSRDDRATASQLSKGRDSSQSAPRSSSAKPSSSPPSHRHAAPSHHASGAVREYAKLGDSQSVGRPHGHAYEHSRSDRSYGRGDRSSSREYAPSHRADSASLRHPQGGERGRRSESSDRPDYRSAHHEVEQHGSRRHYSSEGDSRSAYGASSESSRRPSTAALDRHHAAAPTEPESYHHHRSWWTERPPPVAAATASHYHHRFPQQHQQQEYHRQQPDYHHNADYYRAAPPPTSGTTPTFAYADLPHKWERKPPHVLLRGTHHGSSHQVIYVDGDYYKWFGTSWICRGPTYPD